MRLRKKWKSRNLPKRKLLEGKSPLDKSECFMIFFGNGLKQTQTDAKQTYLNKQREQMLDQYRNANANERGAITRHIDSFLSVVLNDARIFWLKFRENLGRINEQKFLTVE